MQNNRSIAFNCIIAYICFCGVLPLASASVFSSGATWSNRGWKCSYATDVTPDASVRIYSDVIHSDGGDQPVFHRIFVDPSTNAYFGYDIMVQVTDRRAHTAAVRLLPLTLTVDQVREALTKFIVGHPGRNIGLSQEVLAALRVARMPRLSPATFSSGQTLALNVMENSATGQKVTDYIKVSWDPEPWMLETGDVIAPPRRDLKVTDMTFHVVGGIELRINGQQIKRAIVADDTFDSKLLEISVAGYGRFLLSLDPRSTLGFQQLGEVRGRTISFAKGNDHFELRTTREFVPVFGVWNLYVLSRPLSELPSAAIDFWYAPVSDVSDDLK